MKLYPNEDIQGSKRVDAANAGKKKKINKDIHSYAIQMTINATVKFVNGFFLVLKESMG